MSHDVEVRTKTETGVRPLPPPSFLKSTMESVLVEGGRRLIEEGIKAYFSARLCLATHSEAVRYTISAMFPKDESRRLFVREAILAGRRMPEQMGNVYFPGLRATEHQELRTLMMTILCVRWGKADKRGCQPVGLSDKMEVEFLRIFETELAASSRITGVVLDDSRRLTENEE